MNRWGALVGVGVLVFALAGCSGAHNDPAEPAQAVAAPSTEPTNAASSANDAAFVAKVRAVNKEITYTDADLLAYGATVCADLAAGTDASDISVIPEANKNSFDDNGTVIASAKLILCP